MLMTTNGYEEGAALCPAQVCLQGVWSSCELESPHEHHLGSDPLGSFFKLRWDGSDLEGESKDDYQALARNFRWLYPDTLRPVPRRVLDYYSQLKP
jgi:hypothetical protein